MAVSRSSWVGSGRPAFLDEACRVGDDSGVSFQFAMQTNGTLLDEDWLTLLARHSVRIGVSCDGPQEVHDRERVDRSGRGSYTDVRRAIYLLAATYDGRWGILTVANPSMPGSTVLKHFAGIGVTNVDFLWPDFHHDDPRRGRAVPSAPTTASSSTAGTTRWISPPRIRWLNQ